MRVNSGEHEHHFYIDTAPELETDGGQLLLDWPNATSVRRWGRFMPKYAKQWMFAEQRFAQTDWVIEMRGRIALTARNRVRTNETPARHLEVLGVWSDDGKMPAQAYVLYVACREVRGVAIAAAGAAG